MMKITELPENTKSIVQRLVEKGCIEEKDGKVEITEEMATILMILDRADVFN